MCRGTRRQSKATSEAIPLTDEWGAELAAIMATISDWDTPPFEPDIDWADLARVAAEILNGPRTTPVEDVTAAAARYCECCGRSMGKLSRRSYSKRQFRSRRY
jgi:hypothetical protein